MTPRQLQPVRSGQAVSPSRPIEPRNRSVKPRASLWARLVLLTLLTWLPSSCRAPSLPSFNAASAGWEVVVGQALWTLPGADTSVAGDYLLATHPDGRCLIEFTKGGLPLAAIRCTREAWRLELPAEGRSFGGRGVPPTRSAWLVLARDLTLHPPPASWHFDVSRSGVLQIQSALTGEILELHRAFD